MNTTIMMIKATAKAVKEKAENINRFNTISVDIFNTEGYINGYGVWEKTPYRKVMNMIRKELVGGAYIPLEWIDELVIKYAKNDPYFGTYIEYIKNNDYIINNRYFDSEYQLTLEDNIIFWQLSQEAQEFIKNISFTEEGDYTRMLLRSFLYGEKQGISYDKIEPYAHVVYRTTGGHITCEYLTPYCLYMMYGRYGVTPAQLHNLRGIDNTTKVYKLLPEDDLEMVAQKLDIYLMENPAWGAIQEVYYYTNRGFASIEGFYKWKTFVYKNKEGAKEGFDKYVDYVPVSFIRKKAEIEKAFKEKCGRMPRCIDILAKLELDMEPQEIVDNFNFKVINKYKDITSLSLYYAVKASYILGKKGVTLTYKTIIKTLQKKRSAQLIDWILNHTESNEQILLEVIEYYKLLDLSKSMDVIKQRVEMLKSPAYRDYITIYNKYGDKFNIMQSVNAEYNNYTASMLNLSKEKGVIEAVGLGYATDCCQHIDGAGETAMLYSLYHGGFWKAEKSGKLLAQAACWTHKGKFVFDNIEFTNDRDASCIVPILRKWLEKCPWEDVYMGTGYNVLTYGLEKKSYKKVGLKLPEDNRIDDEIYTDAEYVVELKKGGEVLL